MKMSDCKSCRYLQKRWRRDKFGRFVDGYYGCNFLPHWGTPIENVKVCPKIEQGREESTLSSICKVNTR